MRLTKDNIDNFLNSFGDLNLYGNKEVTHIDYIPDNIKFIRISKTNIEEITCELPEWLKSFFCFNSKLNKLPLLPKSLEYFDGRFSKLPKKFQVGIWEDNIQCNNLRNLQLLELI